MVQTRTHNGYGHDVLPAPVEAPATKEHATPRRMTRIEMFIVTNLNNGEIVCAADLQSIMNRVARRFGGYTIHFNLVGGWASDSNPHCQDKILKIEIEVDYSLEVILAVTALGSFIRELLEQETVFITFEDVEVLYV